MSTIGSRIKHAWNAFITNNKRAPTYYGGVSYGTRPDQVTLSNNNAKTIMSSVLNRIAVDVSQKHIMHAQLDENDRFLYQLDTKLNNCLTLEANIDQSSMAFFHDVVLSMLDEGYVAIAPIDTTTNIFEEDSFDIETMRVGKIVEWYPEHVKLEVYNERTGKKEQLIFKKRSVAILENPFYAVMNTPNSTYKRLNRKVMLLDKIDEMHGSGKLDLIIQLPFAAKTDLKRGQAEERLKSLEDQLTNSPRGIAYIDATEKVTQLNRPIENTLASQVESLTIQMLSQLGITQGILDGSASEQEMMNYNSRIIEVILDTIVLEMKRKFLTKTARTQNKSIVYFGQPFKLVSISSIADIADKFTRNEILTSNEVRQIVGFKPSSDPKADELRNKNINQSDAELNQNNQILEEEEIQNGNV